jgi:aspartate-semialdehyde dehydrogenase
MTRHKINWNPQDVETPSLSGLAETLGSPSSDTPETDKEESPHWPISAILHARKMERERDAAIAVISAIEERYIDGCETYEDWKFMGDTARAFLSENVNVDTSAKRVVSEHGCSESIY